MYVAVHIYNLTGTGTGSLLSCANLTERDGAEPQIGLGPSRMLRLSSSVFRSIRPLLCSSVCGAKHTLPDLPYDYNALEPTISAEIMKLHHGKHHATYVNNYNILEEQLHEAMVKQDTTKIIALQVR